MRLPRPALRRSRTRFAGGLRELAMRAAMGAATYFQVLLSLAVA